MATIYYPAVIERAGEGYSVFFPDLPGCVSAGDTIEQAMSEAEAALDLHLEGAAEDGEAVPPPSPPDALALDADIQPTAIVLVRADRPGKTVRVNITLDEALLQRIDTSATAAGMTRSGFLAEAARAKIRAA